MTKPDKLIADVLAAAHGEIVGRIRLQKIVYLLDQVGMDSGLRFHYHHYGPYSRELDEALFRAQALQGVREDILYRQIDGMPYSIFRLGGCGQCHASGSIGRLPAERARDLIQAMKSESSTVLELAATIRWLVEEEKATDWRTELVRRKGAKTERGRTSRAVALLERLGLALT
ncbi:MAG: hypothetical protein WB710_01370 [Stellaceae bacterium]